MLEILNPPEQPEVATEPEYTVGNNRGLTQAYILRDLTQTEAVSLRDAPLTEDETRSARANALASLVRAWDIASERIRIIRGRPLPGSLKPVAAERSTSKRKPAVPVPLP